MLTGSSLLFVFVTYISAKNKCLLCSYVGLVIFFLSAKLNLRNWFVK